MIDEHGDRMKFFEKQNSHSFDDNYPLYVRIDGRSFSRFTKGLKKPFDEKLSNIMIETTKELLIKTNATIGYTQSDEISLVLCNKTPESKYMFSGRSAKLHSVFAALATSIFMSKIVKDDYFKNYIDKLPHFDCRICQLPYEEVANMVTWRYKDATRNAIQSVGQSIFSHKQLQHKSTNEVLEMIKEHGIDYNTYPAYFKYGSFVFKEQVLKQIPNSENYVFRNVVESYSIADFPAIDYQERHEFVFQM